MPTVAVIGASNDRSKYGNKAVRAYQQKGWTVYPINPREKEVEGLRCYASINDTPIIPDYASLYIPPSAIPAVLEEIAAKGTKKVYFNPGTESDDAVAKAKALGLKPIMACSILAIGLDPERMN